MRLEPCAEPPAQSERQEPNQRHRRSRIHHPYRRRPALQLLAETAQPAEVDGETLLGTGVSASGVAVIGDTHGLCDVR